MKIDNLFDPSEEEKPYCESLLGNKEKVYEFGKFANDNYALITKAIEGINYLRVLDSKEYSEKYHDGMREVLNFLLKCSLESGLIDEEEEVKDIEDKQIKSNPMY